MYLKSLEICGFKSFPKKTILKFEPGITIIVGPNGCGKSNVLDSIRWALGEQSPKSLRGTKMEDVIFGGTEKLPSFNFAEVTLTFSNPNRVMNVDFEEVSITRKIFRSGESEYYLNRSPVRKKDIQDLLLSVGLGEGSYSFVAQGTIENILTAKPEDKRVIFDEASGILQFKERKREVSRKLAETDDNLTRLEDIITEVKRQRDSLQRQVQRAKRYTEIQQDLKEIEKNIAVVKVRDVSQRESLLKDELDNLTQEHQRKNQSLKEKRTQVQTKEQEIEALRREYQQINTKSANYDSQVANLRHTIETNKQRIDEFQERLNNLNDNSTVYSQKVNEQQERIRQLKQERKSLDEKEAESKTSIEDNAQRIEFNHSQNKAEQKIIKDNKAKIMSLETEKTNVYNELVDAQSQINSLSSRKKRLLMEVSKSQQEYQEQAEKVNQVKEEAQKISDNSGQIKSNQEALLEKIRFAEQKWDASRQEKEAKEKNLLRLVSQLEFLKNLNMRYHDFPQAEDVTLTVNEDFPDLPSVIVARIDENSHRERVEGFVKIRTKVKIISQGIEQLENKKKLFEDQLWDIDKNIKEIEEANALLYRQREESESALLEKERELLRLKEVEKNQHDNLQRLKEEKELFEFELQQAQEELASLGSKHQELKNQSDSIGSQIADIQRIVTESEERVNNNKEQTTSMEMEITRLQTLLGSLEEEKKTKDSTIEIFTNDLATMVSQLDSLEKEHVQLKDKIENHQQQNEWLLKDIELKNNENLKIKENIGFFAQKQDKLISEHKQIDVQTADIQQELDGLNGRIYDKKLQIQNLAFERDKVISDLKQLYEVELDLEEVKSVKEEGFSLEKLSSSEEELKRKLKYLGNVNLGALEEYDELNQRFEFLETQREDLISSKESLKKAISKINRTCKTMFTEMFGKIQEEFRKLFRFLFGGGKAEIFLLDPENVLDSGIDIVVQPPEKKLQNVTLLSGGEKSLTAMALIFSIFKIKPSPLCILDEIDAPLDESNVDRFNHVLSEFSQKSQFVVISHNKKTISQADVMYGVTMQESGVSKIVSVKFKEHASASSVADPAQKIS